MADSQVVSDALRDEFTKQGKSHEYFYMLDYSEDKNTAIYETLFRPGF